MFLSQLRTALGRRVAYFHLPRSPRRFESSTSPKTTKPAETTAATTTPAANATTTVSIWQRLGPLTTAANAYTRANKKRPWVTQVSSSLVVFLLADLNAQRIGGKEYDPIRTRNMLITGTLFSIPAYEWFKALGGWFVLRSFPLSIAARVLFNQFTFAPVLNAYFFSMQALLTGADAWARVKEKLPETWLRGWLVWPAVIAANLAFVPIQFRGMLAGCVGVGWQTYLSLQNRRAEVAEAKRSGIESVGVNNLLAKV